MARLLINLLGCSRYLQTLWATIKGTMDAFGWWYTTNSLFRSLDAKMESFQIACYYSKAMNRQYESRSKILDHLESINAGSLANKVSHYASIAEAIKVSREDIEAH